MKHTYETPSMTVLHIAATDIIRTSGGDTDIPFPGDPVTSDLAVTPEA